MVDQESAISGGPPIVCVACGEYYEGDLPPDQVYPSLASLAAPKRGGGVSPPPLSGSMLIPPAPYAPYETLFTFYVGCKKPAWVMQRFKAQEDLIPIPVPGFVSYHELKETKGFRPAAVRWALDSGGYTELGRHGTWTIEPERYAADVQRAMHEIGGLDFACIQDWMTEEQIRLPGRIYLKGKRSKGTGLSVLDHQHRTVESYLRLRELAPEVPWIPVLQGDSVEDYYYCMALYASAGVSLRELQLAPRVGIGSVCRRQGLEDISLMLRDLRWNYGLTNMHGFGYKVQGLLIDCRYLRSADSMAWSMDAKRQAEKKINELGHSHGDPSKRREGFETSSCKNCPDYAVRWRDRLVQKFMVAFGAAQDYEVAAAQHWLERYESEDQDTAWAPGEQMTIW